MNILTLIVKYDIIISQNNIILYFIFIRIYNLIISYFILKFQYHLLTNLETISFPVQELPQYLNYPD